VDSVSILAAARELFACRHYSGVVAACADAVAELPPHDRCTVALRLLAARGLLALRRDRDAQSEIRECLRVDPQCAPAYRLLGELAIRADELGSARIFLREALRLAPDDSEARDWLTLVDNLGRAGVVPPTARARATAASPANATPHNPTVPRMAPLRINPPPSPGPPRRLGPPSLPRPPSPVSAPRLPLSAPATIPPMRSPPRATSAPLPLASGFGQHLVACGLLSLLQLKAALAYKRSTGVRLGAAAVALGFLSEPKIEWASLAYHGRHRVASS
jgi:tetratricopeptide (TPR) repeat protein